MMAWALAWAWARAYVVESLHAAFDDDSQAIGAHRLRCARCKLDDLSLGHLGDGWDVLADATLLERRVLHLRDTQLLAARCADGRVEAAVVALSKAQPAEQAVEQAGREDLLAQRDAFGLTMLERKVRERAEDVTVRPGH